MRYYQTINLADHKGEFMLESIVLGMIHGICEWLPVNAERMIVLAKIRLFHATDLSGIIQHALPLRWGSTLALCVYFHQDIRNIFHAIITWSKADEKVKKITALMTGTILVAGVTGAILMIFLMPLSYYFQTLGKIIALLIIILLFATSILQRKIQHPILKNVQKLNLQDIFVLGAIQGLAILPGLSRTGATIACFLMRQFDQTTSIRLSFLMAIPFMLANNIMLGLAKGITFSSGAAAGFFSAFIISLLTIHGFLKVAGKIDLYKFTLLFALLFLLSLSL